MTAGPEKGELTQGRRKSRKFRRVDDTVCVFITLDVSFIEKEEFVQFLYLEHCFFPFFFEINKDKL